MEDKYFILSKLKQSKFRTSFFLNDNMKKYTMDKGIATIKEHAYDFIEKRLAPADILNDGKQTPTRRNSHPVFIAQHATATCCRGCLEKWYKIPKGREITKDEIDYIVDIIMTWIENQCK